MGTRMVELPRGRLCDFSAMISPFFVYTHKVIMAEFLSLSICTNVGVPTIHTDQPETIAATLSGDLASSA